MRNREFIRQWDILRRLHASRFGCTIKELADDAGVHQRTIRRDLEALSEAGFPVYQVDEDAVPRRWKLDQRPFQGMEQNGFTLFEVCALYFSRSLLECLAGTPFQRDLTEAFDKIAHSLPPQIRSYLDKLPTLLVAKGPALPVSRTRGEQRRVGELVSASLDRRLVRMQYFSFAHNRQKEYIVEPTQVVYGNGALYLIAFVPEYDEVRTFALERIKELVVLEERFEPRGEPSRDVFPNSLGIHTGPPTPVHLEFSQAVARYISERVWHASQTLDTLGDGRVSLTLEVCDDWALRTWILGFGSHVRVVAPRDLAESVLNEIELARRHYRPVIDFDGETTEDTPSASDTGEMPPRLPLGSAS